MEFQLQPTSRLLSLPAELRNRIYEYAVSEQDAYHLSRGPRWMSWAPGYRTNRTAFQTPAILQVCRQTSAEASPIFYSITAFQYNDAWVLTSWLKMLDNKNVQHIRKIHMQTSPFRDVAAAVLAVQQAYDFLDEDGFQVEAGCVYVKCVFRNKEGKGVYERTNEPAAAAARIAEE